jgi:hypothetical protein
MAIFNWWDQVSKVTPDLILGHWTLANLSVDLLKKRTACDKLSYQVELLMHWIIYDFIELDDIWMILLTWNVIFTPITYQFLKDSDLSLHCAVCVLILTKEDFLEFLLIHDLHGEKLFRFLVHHLCHLWKLALTKDIQNYVLVNHLLPIDFCRYGA